MNYFGASIRSMTSNIARDRVYVIVVMLQLLQIRMMFCPISILN